MTLAGAVRAESWYFWRGPEQTGVSRERDLPDRFSIDPNDPNSNLIWKVPVEGRTTPIVMNGRVYLINAAGDGINTQERVICLDANTGQTLWEHRFNVWFTDIVRVRLGWTNLVGDPQTGNVYAHGTQGLLLAFNKDGKILWSHSMTEEYGRISGYGGRVTSPIVDGDLVIVGLVNANWGEQVRGGNRFVAFNKNTGEVVWWSPTVHVGPPKDTYYSVPVVAVINNERLLISGGADGAVHALRVRTGEVVWGYTIGQGAVNCSPVVDGNFVYIGQGEENPDNNFQGRVVCLDASQVQDKKPKLVWQVDRIKAKFASPIIHEGRLYICDEIARMYCLDAKTGNQLWRHKYGRNAKGSPVWADGKIYVCPVNGQFCILKPGDKSCETLYTQDFPSPDNVIDVELNGSPAVADGRIYFSTSLETYCIGKKSRGAAAASIPPKPTEKQPGAEAKVAHLQIVPGDVVLDPGQSVSFKARAFDAHGHFLREVKTEWSVAPMLPPPPVPGAPSPPASAGAAPPPSPPDLRGTITPDGKLTVDASVPGQFGGVIAKAEGISGRARVRVAPLLPYAADFSKVPVGRTPGGWVNTQGKFAVEEHGGRKVLVKTTNNPSPLVSRAHAYLGKPTLTDYTVEAEVLGHQKGSDIPDIGVVANRYTLFLTGTNQTLRLVSWDALPRIDKTIGFPWKPGVWYHMKITVEVQGNKAIARGKVWERGKMEPSDWTVQVEDPVPNTEGSPAIYAFVMDPGTEAYFDNVRVTPNKK
jgi:outer membrane protein assembly factor BamB